MTRLLLLATILCLPSLSEAKRRPELLLATETGRNADEQLRTNPALTPQQRTEQQQIKSGAVEQIETIGNEEAADPETQIDVSKSLVTVSEAPRAIPYAERGLTLAEKSGDPKLVREALLTGADVYYRAGDYAKSRQRAERILKDNPQDKDARMLYMQVKDRGVAAQETLPPPRESPPGQYAGIRYAENNRNTVKPGTSPNVAMTSANSIEARRQLALGRSKMSLDTAAALKHLDAAVAADESDGEARAARARARLASGDATGALQDADAATRLAPRLADGWAVRAEAKRALGRAEAELIEDYAEAARLDPSFKDAFEALVAKASAGGAQNADARNVAGRSAPDDLRGPMTRLPAAVRKYGLISSIAAIALILGGALFLMKRSDGDGAPRG